MATIAQIVAQIRTAIFGKDVRESIAQGIEKCYSDVEGASHVDASLSKSGNVLTFSVTNRNNQTTTETLSVEGIIDDTAGEGDTTVTWSANKSTQEIKNLIDENGIQDDRTNDLYGYVNYGYNKYFKFVPGTIPASQFTIIRNKTLIYIDGSPTASSSGNYAYVKLNNEPGRSSSTGGLDNFVDPSYFIPGNKYRIIITRISGSCTYNGVASMPTVGIYKQGTHTQPLTNIVYEDNNKIITEFTATDNPCQVIMLRIIDRVFVDFKCSVVMRDLGVESASDCPNTKAPMIEKTISSDESNVFFDDGADNMPVEITIDYTINQNLNGYSHPWIGGTGDNIMPVPLNNGKYINSKTGDIGTTSNSKYYYTDYIPVTPNDVLYIGQNDSTATTAGLAFYSTASVSGYLDGLTWTEIANASNVITVPEGAYFLRHSFNTDYNPNPEENCYITLNSSPHVWSPYENICPFTAYTGCEITQANDNDSTTEGYVEKTYNLAFTGIEDPAYIGKIEIYKDGTGLLTRTYGIINLKNKDMSYSTSGTNPYFRFSHNGFSNATGDIISRFTAEYCYGGRGNSTWLGSSLPNGRIGVQTSNSFFGIRDDRYNDDTLYPTSEDKIAAFKNGLYDGVLIMPLSSPKTYILSAPIIKSLFENNYFAIDVNGTISITYSVDTKKYIDDLFDSILPASGVSF